MATEWTRTPLGAILSGHIRHGIYKPLGSFGIGTRVLKMGLQYSENRIGPQEMPRTKLSTDEIERFKVREGDLLFSRTSMMSEGAGKCSIAAKHLEPFVFDGNILCATVNKEIAEPAFVYYFFQSPEGKQSISEIIAGTQSRSLSSINLASVKINFPPLPEQRAIAEVLGALDDKIELNRRMNATLEEMARAVFRRWFVEGEEVESWKVGKLGDVAENIRRSANPEDIETGTPYIGLEHMPRRSIALSDWSSANEIVSNKFFFKQGEFLFGKLRPYFHKVGIAPLDGVCSTDILVIVPKSSEWYGFVLGHISSVELINYTDAASTGTKMPRTNWADIARYDIPIPPDNFANEYNELLKPIVQQIRANIMQSRTLAGLRDALLPKLMRGEVRVRA